MSRSIALVLALGAILVACAAPGASIPPSASPQPTLSPMPITSDEPSAGPSETPGPAPSGDPADSPSPGAVAIPLDTVVESIVDGLTVRREPGTAGERIGFLELGTVFFVLDGPTAVDGHPWYRVTGMGLPFASGCTTTPPSEPISCPAFQGWVAGAGATGDPWIAATDPGPCPETDLVSISEAGFTWRLVCWNDGPITIDAWWPEIPDDAGLGGACLPYDEPGGFLFCQNINYDGLSAFDSEGFFTDRLRMSIDPDSGVQRPERGQWIRVTGVFDHPDARACADFGPMEGLDWQANVLQCRLEFVPTAIQPLGT